MFQFIIITDSGVCTSSEEETAPPDDGPFAFRRKPGCFYEMVGLVVISGLWVRISGGKKTFRACSRVGKVK